jgi:hypothetical protein
MKSAWWILAVSVLSALGITFLLGTQMASEVWLGMAGPLIAALGTWIAVQRTHRRAPEGVSAVLIKAFGAKIVFFGLYIAVALRSGFVDLVPFVISFTAYFLVLQGATAFLMRRLFATNFTIGALRV